jgi:hypothetical protein
MQKNVTGQKLIVFAFDSTTSLPVSGDAANITAYVSKNYGTVTVLGDTSATEMDATNAKGYYLFDLTQAETNANTLLFSAKSSTANVVVVAVPATVFTNPPNYQATSIDASGRLDLSKFAGQTITCGAGVTILASVGTASTSTAQTGDAFARIGSNGAGLTAIGDTRIANLDATVSSRSTLTQTQVTGGAYSVQSASCVLGDSRIANLDAAVTSRMATYTQPTGFLAATFPTGTIANTTNITAGTITTVTNLTNLPTIPANWITAAGIAADAGTEIANAVWGVEIETGLTAEEVLQLVGAVSLGKSSGNVVGSASTIEFVSAGGSTVRVEGTIDANGNRTSVTLTPG